MRPLLVRGASLIDGTGSPARPADLLVDNDRVAAIEAPGSMRPPSADAWRILEADGLTACPGFIDIHSHGDLVLALPPPEQRRLLAGRIAQGITTQIVGNCGLGVFPRDDATEPLLRAVVGWMTPAANPPWPWSDLAGWMSHLTRQGIWVNAGALQPHGPLRMAAAGLTRIPAGAAQREAVAAMSPHLAAALRAGAFGLSTGLIYPPGIFTPTEELIELARVVSRETRGEAFVASHVRGSSETLLPAVEELLEVGRAAGVAVQHSNSEAVGREHWHKLDAVLRLEEEARRSGRAVAFDMFPYTAAATMMLAIYPPWALDGGLPALLSRLADPGARAAIGEAIDTTVPSWPPWTPEGWPHNLVRAVGWDRIVVGSVGGAGEGANRRCEGMTLADLGRSRGRSPFDAISDLMIEERGVVSQIIHGISGDAAHDEGIERLLSEPSGCVCTDADDFGKGRPHPAAFGTFPRVLGHYVRRRGLLSLETAIHRMTGRPAHLLGLKDRGVLRRGAFADLVVLDPATVDGEATFDEPRRHASGIVCVLVNGAVAHADARRAALCEDEGGDLPAGRVLRRGEG